MHNIIVTHKQTKLLRIVETKRETNDMQKDNEMKINNDIKIMKTTIEPQCL